MLQAAFLGCLFLDLCPFSNNGFIATEVNIGWRYVVEAFVVTLVVVIFDESSGLLLPDPLAGSSFPVNPVLHGLVSSFYFALCLWVEWCAPNVLHVLILQPLGQIS